jgi:1,4-alpha-glucan branching enzyme
LRTIFVFLVFADVVRSQESLGAIVNKSGTSVTGVTFRVWAPHATGAAVCGEFNAWGETAMTKDSATGYWTATVPAARPGQEYKYFLRWAGNTSGAWKHDPRTFLIRNGNSVIYDHSAFDWGTTVRPSIPVDQQVMYELHIGSFFDPNPADNRPGTFDDAISRLGYLQGLGVNVIALMPVNEYGGDYSWGYNPEHLFAIESAYGGPDGLKRFVKAAHARGMKVQLDVVHNHWNPPADGLWEFDGADNIYFYPDSPPGWTAWGSRPNYSQTEVRRFIRESIKALLDDFRVDGFRWDSPQNILGYDAFAPDNTSVGNPQTVLPEGKSLLTEINRMIHAEYPARWSIAEDADLLTVRPAGAWYPSGGFLDLLRVNDEADSFDGHWQTSFHNTITPQIAAASPDVGEILGKVSGWSEPPGYRVIFTDNHDKSGSLNNETRLANRMDSLDPTGKTARKKTLLNAALTLTAPGTPMLWMGQEFQATGPFNDKVPLDWQAAFAQHRVFRAHRDLTEMRELLPALQNSNLDASAGFSNDDLDLMCYWRLESRNAENLVVLFNFSAQDRTVSWPFPTTGTWHVQFNSDWGVYGSDFRNVGPAGQAVTANFEGSAVRADVPVAAYSVIVLATTAAPSGRLTEDADGDGLPDGWEAMTGTSDGVSDDDTDGLANLFEYQNALDPLQKDTATVTYSGDTHALRASSNNPVAQHIAWAVDPVTLIRPSSFTFLSNNIPGPFFTNPAGTYLRFFLNLTNSNPGYSHFPPETNLAVVDTNRTNWAAFHGVTDFSANPDGDSFTNLQEFARGSDPNVSNRAAIHLAGDQYSAFSPSANPMNYLGGNVWTLDLPRRGGVAGQFKFTIGNWSENWGDNAPADGTGDPGGPNIANGFSQGNGIYRFRFNEQTFAYQITYDATDADADGIQDAWIAYYGLTGGNASAAADPDGDGWSNLAEFARFTNANGTFMNPAVSDSAAAPKRMTVTGNTGPLPIWLPNANNMTWSDRRMQWEWTGTFSNTTDIQFKFSQAANSDWSGGGSWGWSAGNSNTGVAVPSGGENIIAAVTGGGRYRFAFQDLAGTYSVTAYPVFAEWWETNGLPAPLPSTASDPRWNEDPDGDGYTHLVEYALGGTPLAGDSRLFYSWQTNVGGAKRLVLRWLERTDAEADFSVVPLLSTNLSSINWSVLTATDSADTSGVPANYRRREVSVPVEGASKFLRLRVTGP